MNGQTTLYNVWPALRALLSTEMGNQSQVRDILAAAAVPVHEERFVPSDYSPKISDLLLEMDAWLREQPDAPRSRVIVNVFEEILRYGKQKRLAPNPYGLSQDGDTLSRLETLCARCGWRIVNDSLIPLHLQAPQELATLPAQYREGLDRAITRYRDGDFAGAITLLYSTIDEIIKGAPLDKSFQARVVHAFVDRHNENFRQLLRSIGTEEQDIVQVSDNLKKSVSNAAFLIQTVRNKFSDAHQLSQAPPGLVRRGLDAATYIIRCLLET